MSELERLEAFSKAYVDMVEKYNLKITSCCCMFICDYDGHKEDLFGNYNILQEAGVGNINFTFKDGKWVKNE